jgi:hypothetical protein
MQIRFTDPSVAPSYLTAGKLYQVIRYSTTGGVFILDDSGSSRYVRVTRSAHINNQAWEIVQKAPDDSVVLNTIAIVLLLLFLFGYPFVKGYL